MGSGGAESQTRPGRGSKNYPTDREVTTSFEHKMKMLPSYLQTLNNPKKESCKTNP